MKAIKNLDKKFWLIGLAIMALFVLSRFLFLGARPIHHDEGMLAYFAHQIIAAKTYIYTPQIHGPVLFYLTALVFKFSISNAAVRVSMAICGVILGLVALIYLRKESKIITYSTALMLLVSPDLIYYSRFLVHTGIVVFFKTYKSIHLFLASGFLALAFGTSETSYILVAIIVGFIPVLLLTNRKDFVSYWKTTIKFFKENIFDLLSAILIFAIVWLLVYSVGLTNLDSLKISLPNPFDQSSGLGFWLKQHPVKLGGQPWFYYIMLTLVYEILALVAFLAYLPKVFINRRPFEIFLVWWVLGSFIGYSWAGEKFPWLFLPPLLSILVASSYFIGTYWKSTAKYLKIIFAILFLWTIFVAIRLNYLGPYDTREFPVYVQTPKSFQNLENDIKQKCQGKSGECVVLDTQITWPIAWDLNGSNRLEDFSENSQISEDTEYMFVEPNSKVPTDLDKRFNKREVQLRDWWVPEKCTEISCTGKYLNYFFTRKIWNDKGGFNIDLYEKK
jgi:uncharacterized protein (TIGR03663 family)